MVDSDRMLNEFKILASFDSESFHEEEIAAYLYEKLFSAGLKIKKDAAGNIYGFLKGNTEGESLLFSAHMDTVAPGKGKKVIFHEDGKVSSDKTTILGADDITGIVTILEALTVTIENNLPHPDIEVVFFTAEEPYCRGSSKFDFSQIRSKTAYVFDLDGKVGTIANAAPSIVQFELEITGKSAHAGFEPEKGISAISVAAGAISRIKTGRIDEETTANIGLISGGTGRNTVPGTVKVEGEVRSLNAEKAETVVEKIRDSFITACESFEAGLDFDSREMIRAYHINEEAPVVRRYERALESLGYGPARIITTFGGSDANVLNSHGISSIVVSNAMNSVHTTDEYFYMNELIKSAQIAVKLMTL